jgi:hypothetical protein
MQLAASSEETMMAENSDDTKPTVEDVDRMIREYERKNATAQDMRRAIEERVTKGQDASATSQDASKDVQLKKGESLWDRAGREIDSAENDKGAEEG